MTREHFLRGHQASLLALAGRGRTVEVAAMNHKISDRPITKMINCYFVDIADFYSNLRVKLILNHINVNALDDIFSTDMLDKFLS